MTDAGVAGRVVVTARRETVTAEARDRGVGWTPVVDAPTVTAVRGGMTQAGVRVADRVASGPAATRRRTPATTRGGTAVPTDRPDRTASTTTDPAVATRALPANAPARQPDGGTTGGGTTAVRSAVETTTAATVRKDSGSTEDGRNVGTTPHALLGTTVARVIVVTTRPDGTGSPAPAAGDGRPGGTSATVCAVVTSGTDAVAHVPTAEVRATAHGATVRTRIGAKAAAPRSAVAGPTSATVGHVPAATATIGTATAGIATIGTATAGTATIGIATGATATSVMVATLKGAAGGTVVTAASAAADGPVGARLRKGHHRAVGPREAGPRGVGPRVPGRRAPGGRSAQTATGGLNVRLNQSCPTTSPGVSCTGRCGRGSGP